MAALDLLGRRWALRVLWELRHGPVGTRALLARCDGLSSSVLYTRLRELEESRLVVAQDDGWALTNLGAELAASIAPFDDWARRWAKATSRSDKR